MSKHEHWSSLAPLPLEVVVSAGQKAKDDSWNRGKSSHYDLYSIVPFLFLNDPKLVNYSLINDDYL